MAEQPANIRVTQRKECDERKGMPFSERIITNCKYFLSEGVQGDFDVVGNPLEALTEILLLEEQARNSMKHIGPIQASFELLDDERAYGGRMELLLRMYARSENTTVTFNYK